ncbi:prevent-host-death family protein [Bradyrhizobium sp. GM0.4]
MKIDFKTLKMMELRSSPGEVLDRVARDGDVFVIERNGQPKACLVPVSFLLPDINPERISRELSRLNEANEPYHLTINEQKEMEISCRASNSDSPLIRVVLPHGFPAMAPRIYVTPIPEDTPHRWPDGSLAIFGATLMWNPRAHDVARVIQLARAWLKNFSAWQKDGTWPNGGSAR